MRVICILIGWGVYKSGVTGSKQSVQTSIKLLFQGLNVQQEAEKQLKELEEVQRKLEEERDNAIPQAIEASQRKRKASSKSGSRKKRKKGNSKAGAPKKMKTLFSFFKKADWFQSK